MRRSVGFVKKISMHIVSRQRNPRTARTFIGSKILRISVEYFLSGKKG